MECVALGSIPKQQGSHLYFGCVMKFKRTHEKAVCGTPLVTTLVLLFSSSTLAVTSFGGNFRTLNDEIAANSIDFYDIAVEIINGSAVKYSDTSMTLSGNSDLIFNRTGFTEALAGFGPEIITHYIPESCQKVFHIY